MSGRQSFLGALRDKHKTTLHLSRELVDAVETACVALGIPKNAFFSLGAGMLVLQVLSMLPGRKRKAMIDHLEELFARIISEARKGL